MKEKKGITLIALVVTIVVLLILAGVSISMLTGESGIIKQAMDAKDKTIIGQEQEQVEMAYVSAATTKLGDEVTETNLQNELDIIVGETKTNVTTNDDETLNVLFADTQHNYNVNKGEVFRIESEEVPKGIVARIGTVYYGTLQSAIDAITNDNTETTIVLLVDISENVTVAENQNIILNLNNHTITNLSETPIITLSGTLTIKNGIITGTYTNRVATICTNVSSELNLSHSIIDRNSDGAYNWETIELHGVLNIDSGKINSPNSNTICTYPNYESSINIGGTAEVIGSSANYVTIFNCHKMTMTGGKIIGTGNSAIDNEAARRTYYEWGHY